MQLNNVERDEITKHLEVLLRRGLEDAKPLVLASLSGWRKWAVRLLWNTITEKVLLAAALAVVDALFGLVASGAVPPQVLGRLVDSDQETPA